MIESSFAPYANSPLKKEAKEWNLNIKDKKGKYSPQELFRNAIGSASEFCPQPTMITRGEDGVLRCISCELPTFSQIVNEL